MSENYKGQKKERCSERNICQQSSIEQRDSTVLGKVPSGNSFFCCRAREMVRISGGTRLVRCRRAWSQKIYSGVPCAWMRPLCRMTTRSAQR